MTAPEVPDDAALAELALLYGRFIIGRWAEVMASDDEPADDWQEQAAREAVALFAPAAERFKRAVKAAALEEAAEQCDLDATDGHCGSKTCAENNRITARWLRDRAAAYREEASSDPGPRRDTDRGAREHEDEEGDVSAPKHRRCTKRRHHVWKYSGPTGTGWTVARCVMCGRAELA